jgi:hypothetical protein
VRKQLNEVFEDRGMIVFENVEQPSQMVAALKTRVDLVTATMGLAYMMDVPPTEQNELPNLAEITGPDDPRFIANENARVMLHMLTMFLNRGLTLALAN